LPPAPVDVLVVEDALVVVPVESELELDFLHPNNNVAATTTTNPILMTSSFHGQHRVVRYNGQFDASARS
jgi:hypothetical protein